MKIHKLQTMTKGWFVGDFLPSVHKANYEIGLKKYAAGEIEPKHHHRLVTEFTLVVIGKICMNGVLFHEGDIIQVDPFEDIKFECIEDATTVVFKTASVFGDKYITESP